MNAPAWSPLYFGMASVGIYSHAGFYLQTKGGVGAIQINYSGVDFRFFSMLICLMD
jgi:hypothetical protein